MPFRGKKLSDLQEQDLQRLVDDRVQERDTVEYKRDMYGDSRDEKREMLKDITSMANHHGGYIVIGIEADDEGIPTNVLGIESGNYDERITSSCLDNIDKRIVGLDIKDVPLGNGRVVVVLSIPESINAPHMVTHEGLNQFWKRHGKQKDKMIIDEIGEAFDRRLSNLNRLDRFLFTRKAEILESIGKATFMAISASPARLLDEAILSVHDGDLRQMIQNPPQLAGGNGDICYGNLYPTINGLRAGQGTPYYDNPSFDGHIEVFRNGYIEFGRLIINHPEVGIRIADLEQPPRIVNFMGFIQGVYEQYLPLRPIVVSFAIYNAKNIYLAADSHSSEKFRWQKQHLELGKFYVENISEERKLLTKGICDRLWQCFHREKCNLFDDAGTFRTS